MMAEEFQVAKIKLNEENSRCFDSSLVSVCLCINNDSYLINKIKVKVAFIA